MRVLIIDDDIGMTDLLTILLTPASSQVLTANTPQQGLDLLRKNQPDVIILDYSFPNDDGWRICSEIRAISDVPLLILSANDSPGMVAEALNRGADDYLTKPVSSATLIARLNKLVRRTAQAPKSLPDANQA